MTTLTHGVLGLDLSLTRPAACYLPSGWRPGDWGAIVAASWPSKPAKPHAADGPLERERARWARVSTIAHQVGEFVHAHAVAGTDAIAVEDYPYGMQGTAVTGLAELRGAVCTVLRSISPQYVPLPLNISTCRKLLLGKLPSRRKGEPPLPKGAAKVAVQQALYGAGAFNLANDDECDAFAVANALLSDCGAVAVSFADATP